MAVVGVGVAQVGVGESQKKRIERHHFGVPNREYGILLLVGLKKEITSSTRKVATTLIPLLPQYKVSYRHHRSRKQEIRNPRYHELRETRRQGLLRSREHDVRRSRIYESKISAGTEFQISKLLEARASRTLEVKRT